MHATKLDPLKIEIPERFNAAVHFIDRHLQEDRGNNIAIYYKEKKVSYSELQEMVNRTGNALRNLGVEIENRVLLILQLPLNKFLPFGLGKKVWSGNLAQPLFFWSEF